MALPGSHEAEVAQFAPQLLRHGRARSAPGLVEVRRRVLGGEVAPTLEGAKRPRIDRHHFRLEHDAATPDAVLVPIRAQVADALAAGNLAAYHPIERASVGELGRPLRHHAGAVNMLRLFA